MCLKKHKNSGEKQRLHPLFLELPLSSPHISGRSPLPPKHPSLTLPFISTWSLFWDQFQSPVHFHLFAVCLTCNKITVVRTFWSTTWSLHGQHKNPVFVSHFTFRHFQVSSRLQAVKIWNFYNCARWWRANGKWLLGKSSKKLDILRSGWL